MCSACCAAAASLPAAEDNAIEAHRKQEQRIQRQIDDLGGKADNLLRAVENNTDPDGLIFGRLRTRMIDLDREIAALSKSLADLPANAPKPPTDNVGLLDHLPLVEVDLNDMAADRLRRFLDAFRVQIHYDAHPRRATLRAEISAHVIEELTRVAGWGPTTA